MEVLASKRKEKFSETELLCCETSCKVFSSKLCKESKRELCWCISQSPRECFPNKCGLAPVSIVNPSQAQEHQTKCHFERYWNKKDNNAVDEGHYLCHYECEDRPLAMTPYNSASWKACFEICSEASVWKNSRIKRKIEAEIDSSHFRAWKWRWYAPVLAGDPDFDMCPVGC